MSLPPRMALCVCSNTMSTSTQKPLRSIYSWCRVFCWNICCVCTFTLCCLSFSPSSYFTLTVFFVYLGGELCVHNFIKHKSVKPDIEIKQWKFAFFVTPTTQMNKFFLVVSPRLNRSYCYMLCDDLGAFKAMIYNLHMEKVSLGRPFFPP